MNAHVVHDALHAAGESLARQTLATATRIGKHPVGTPEAPTAVVLNTVFQLFARSVSEKDVRMHTFHTPTIDEHGTRTVWNTVCCVETSCTVGTLATDCPVGDGTML